jgi:hypothetical protein
MSSLRIMMFLLVVISACSQTGNNYKGFGPVQVAGDSGSARTPIIFESDEETILFVWSEDRGDGPDLYIQEFDLAGEAVGDSRLLTDSHNARRPQVTKTDSGLVIAWSDRVDGMMEVMAAGLDLTTSGYLEPINVSQSKWYPSTSPKLTTYRGDALLVWVDRTYTFLTDAVMLVALDAQGNPIEEPIAVSDQITITTLQPFSARVAVSSKRILIVANDFNQIEWNVGLTNLSSLSDSPEYSRPFQSGSHHWAPDVGYFQNGYLIAFRDNGPALPVIKTTWVDSQLSEFNDPVDIDTPSGFVHEPTVLTEEDLATVIWREEAQDGVVLKVSQTGKSGPKRTPEIVVSDVGLGEPASGLITQKAYCLAYETLRAGHGSVFLFCGRRP